MSDTANLVLPLMQPAQAQKHITVNSALARLDAVTHLRIVSVDLTSPPSSPSEGAVWPVPVGASGAWSGQGGSLAVFLNGGWDFVVPARGWRAFIVDRSVTAVWDGNTWLTDVLAFSSGSAQTLAAIREADVVITPGPSITTGLVIQPNSVIIGVTARVRTGITGTLASWQLGVASDLARFGSGLGLATGSIALGVSGSPSAYYAATPLILTASGGAFAAGNVRLAIHTLTIVPPTASV